MNSVAVSKREAYVFVEIYSAMQDYIGCVNEIAEASPVGFTDEARTIQKQLSKLYASPSWHSLRAKMEKLAGKDIEFKSRP